MHRLGNDFSDQKVIQLKEPGEKNLFTIWKWNQESGQPLIELQNYLNEKCK